MTVSTSLDCGCESYVVIIHEHTHACALYMPEPLSSPRLQGSWGSADWQSAQRRTEKLPEAWTALVAKRESRPSTASYWCAGAAHRRTSRSQTLIFLTLVGLGVVERNRANGPHSLQDPKDSCCLGGKDLWAPGIRARKHCGSSSILKVSAKVPFFSASKHPP